MTTAIANDNCRRCKKVRNTWTENRESFRSYCCWGCADNTGCICGRKTHRRAVGKAASTLPKMSNIDPFQRSSRHFSQKSSSTGLRSRRSH